LLSGGGGSLVSSSTPGNFRRLLVQYNLWFDRQFWATTDGCLFVPSSGLIGETWELPTDAYFIQALV
jgi:hypothetical protein